MSVVHVGWFMDGAPRSVPALTAAVAIAGTVAVRSVWRLYQQKQTKRELLGAAPLLIVGAGEGGEQIVKALLSDPTSRYQPVALLDDDPNRRRYSISGVQVQGPISQMREVAARYGAEDVLLAIPSADQRPRPRRRRDRQRTPGSGCSCCRRCTRCSASSASATSARSRRPICSVADPPTSTPMRSPATSPAGGCWSPVPADRSAASSAVSSRASNPTTLLKLDRDESGLHAVQLSIHGRALLDSDDLLLADIRDRDRLFEVFEQHRPEVVFHAAALKHLPLLEAAPARGVEDERRRARRTCSTRPNTSA